MDKWKLEDMCFQAVSLTMKLLLKSSHSSIEASDIDTTAYFPLSHQLLLSSRCGQVSTYLGAWAITSFHVYSQQTSPDTEYPTRIQVLACAWGPKSEERDVLFSTGQKQGHDGSG